MKKPIFSVLITAGPTQEPIDPVRYISNHSSGKMGYALAQVCLEMGLSVILITGPTQITPPDVNQLISVVTAKEMLDAVLKEISNTDLFIACAAVADYQPKIYSSQKIKKKADSISIQFIKTPDILKTVSLLSKKPILVGFCAETDSVVENAKQKIIEKNLDFILANVIKKTGEPFHSNENEIVMIDKNFHETFFHQDTKLNLARKILKMLISMP